MSRTAALLCCFLLTAVFICAQNPAANPAATSSPPQRPLATQPIGPPPPNATAKELEDTGDLLRARKSYADAIDYYNAAIRRGGENGGLRNKIGMAKLLSQRKDAQKEFERAIKLEPNNPDPRCNLGVYWYSLRKNNGRAIKYYLEAIQLDAERASFHSALGTAYMDSKQYVKANEEYMRALELDPGVFEHSSPYAVSAHALPIEERARFYFDIAKLYAQRGDTERALRYLEKAKEDGYQKLAEALTATQFDKLRSDPRFQQVVNPKPATQPRE
jgi:tetratricopeptide (TPR) repeat protein